MIKIILVDDEYLVIERLKKCLDWEAAGFAIAGQALNGEEALELVAALQPQLAIVDINMPLIDGLEFAKIARDKYPALKVVILSGYSSFDYARSALQAGVTDYLLKPVNPAELQKLLGAIKQRIEQEAHFQSYLSDLETTSTEKQRLVRERWLQSFLTANGELPSEAVTRQFQEYFPEVTGRPIYVAVFRFDKMTMEKGMEDANPWLNANHSGIFATVEQGMENPIIFPDSEGHLVVLMNAACLEDDRVIGFCEVIQKKFGESFQATVTLGLSDRHQGIAALGAAYREARAALENGIILGLGRIIAYTGLTKDQTYSFASGKIRQELLIHLRLRDENAIAAQLRQIFQPFRERRTTAAQLKLVVTELLLVAADFMRENGKKPGAPAAEEQSGRLNPAEWIRRSATLAQLQADILNLYLSLIPDGSGSRKSGAQRLVERAKEYIDANYQHPEMNLDHIAGAIFVNPSHLSNVFKRETGIALMEYVREQRMLRAKELLDRGCLSIGDIAARVGFHDENYFSKCFKKKYGVAPSILIQAR